MVVCHCDGYFRFSPTLGDGPPPEKAKRFLDLAARLPMDLQMMLCNRVFGLDSDVITANHSEPGFRRVFARVERPTMNQIWDDFKREMMIKDIIMILWCRRSLEKPRFDAYQKRSPDMFQYRFGERAFAQFEQMTTLQREHAVTYYEKSRDMAAGMLGWKYDMKSEIVLDLVKFKADFPALYAEVVQCIVRQECRNSSFATQQAMIAEFEADPGVLQAKFMTKPVSFN